MVPARILHSTKIRVSHRRRIFLRTYVEFGLELSSRIVTRCRNSFKQLCCIVFILLNTVYRGNGEQETSKEEASKEEKEYHGEDDFFPEELEMAEAYSQWELAERTTQAAVTTAMVCGVCAHAGSFLFPFLLWTPVQAAVNLIMMAAAVRREDKTCLVLGMLLCFDVYGWGVVYSARQQMK